MDSKARCESRKALLRLCASRPHTLHHKRHPNSAHFASLAVCFLSSAASDASDAVAPTADKAFNNRDVKASLDSSPVEGYPPALTGRALLPPGLTNVPYLWKDSMVSTKMSRRLLWRNIASPSLLQVVAWWSKGSRELPAYIIIAHIANHK